MPLLQTPACSLDATSRALDAAAWDEDLALGWECALPALQFEAWDPAPSTWVDGVPPTAS